MRKLVILICILITGGAVYALVPNLFPDNSLFPRVPTAEGTIGNILEKLLVRTITDASQDGTVKNSMKLDNRTATGYLKRMNCSGTQVWTGITADGTPNCADTAILLADYGTISEQGCAATVYHADGTFTSTSNTGDTLKSGDIVKTQNLPNCTLTIAFADLSILRLDIDTTVSLDLFERPSEPGKTIASAILENGSLWGRILTDTGSYSIGTDKIVAGVRGTSIALVSTGNTLIIGSTMSTASGWIISKTPTPNYNTELVIVDSINTTSPDNPAATVYCRGTGGTATPLNNMDPENQYTIATSGAGCLPAGPPRALTSSAATLYARSPWIRRNTQKDVNYMYRLLARSGSSLSLPRFYKINNELTLSQPPDSPLDSENKNICESGQKWWTPRYGCQPNTLYAIADYTLPIISGVSQSSTPFVGTPTTLIYSGSSSLIGLPEMPGSKSAGVNGVEITQVGQYIQYYPDPNFTGGLMGGVMTIELASPVGSSVPNPLGNKWYVADLGTSTSRFFVWKNTNCSGTSTTGINWLCPSNIDVTNSLTISIPLSTSTIAAIGNIWLPSNTSIHLKGPIGTSIKKLTISN